VSPFFTSARTASETSPIRAGSRSPIARTDQTANHDPVSSKFKTVALSVYVQFFGCRHAEAMSARPVEMPMPLYRQDDSVWGSRSSTPASRGFAETWPDQPENQTCRSVRYALSRWEGLALFIGDGGIELLEAPLP
jgi:hypothetical protein